MATTALRKDLTIAPAIVFCGNKLAGDNTYGQRPAAISTGNKLDKVEAGDQEGKTRSGKIEMALASSTIALDQFQAIRDSPNTTYARLSLCEGSAQKERTRRSIRLGAISSTE